MAFKAPPKILQKILRFNAIKFKEGKLLVVNVPGLLSPLYVNIYLQRLLENDIGEKKAMNLLYNIGKFQGIQGLKITNNYFGYAKTIKNKRELLIFSGDQSEVTGLGKFKWVLTDFNKNIFIVRGKCSIGEEYKRFFGIQKNAVDHFTRGQAAAMVEGTINQQVLAVETKCIATGNPYCEFVVKPIKIWDKKDVMACKQLVGELSSFKKLGAQMAPYLALA